MDFSKLYNPYDFANPVIDPKLFAGRKGELEEIEYYLNHAKNAPRAINLALIGDRASGKTSLLNMIEGGAKQRGFCTVRIDLDESDVETQIVFFAKLFDGILTAACKEGAFGGIQGKTYDTYRSMIDAHEIPDDRTFCPFIFPMQYAKAIGKGNDAASVSDPGYKDDISRIQTEMNKPIAILVDECDVLTKSRVHLEKLRNIFMNITGFFLVFTGTGAFFPLINDVFSPIIRQFKKINVKPFDSESETKDCIEKPLKGLGIYTQEIFDMETYREIDAIHNLSGGRPYEIQLICHQLFKRVQEGRASKLQLSVDVLDDVLNELQSLQDVNVRPVVQHIRNLSKEELSALGVLLMSNKRIDFEQAWYLECMFNEKTTWGKSTLKENLDLLISKNLIKAENDILSFSGDDFDRIYCKYYSRKQGVVANINDISFNNRLRIGVELALRQAMPNINIKGQYNEYIEDLELEKIIDDFSNQRFEFFDKNIELAEVLYRSNVENQDLLGFPLICVTLRTPWERIQSWYTIEDPSHDYTVDTYLNEFERIFRYIKERSQENDSEFSIKVFIVPVLPIDNIVGNIVSITSQRLKSKIASIHAYSMYECYTGLQDLDGAKYHGELALLFEPAPESAQSANNLGYLFMSIGETEKAKSLFETAEKQIKILPDGLSLTLPIDISDFFSGMDALVHYNLGIVWAMQHDFEKAVSFMKTSIEESRKMKGYKCACLFVPDVVGNQIKFQEVIEPNLLETATSSAEKIQAYAVEQLKNGLGREGPHPDKDE